MPLYELVCVAKNYTQYTPIQTLVQQTAAYVHSQGGCVRRLDSHGLQRLPKVIRKDGEDEHTAHYWSMLFDTNPMVLRDLGKRMRSDPRVLRWTTLKKGTTLEQVTQSTHFTNSSMSYPAAPSTTTLLNTQALNANQGNRGKSIDDSPR